MAHDAIETTKLKHVSIRSIVRARRRASTFSTKRNIFHLPTSTTDTLHQNAVESPSDDGTSGEMKNTGRRNNTGNDNDDADHRKINIVLVGNQNVGKTSLLFQLARGKFSVPYIATTGVDFSNVMVRTHHGEKVRVKFWDTSGDVRSKNSIARHVYPLASGFIIMYDVTDVQSYNDIFHWMKLLDTYALDNAKIVIVGNKTDLRMRDQVEGGFHLTKEDGMTAAFCYKVKFMETSVRTNRNIGKTVKRLVTNICDGNASGNRNTDCGVGGRRKKSKVTFSPMLKDGKKVEGEGEGVGEGEGKGDEPEQG